MSSYWAIRAQKANRKLYDEVLEDYEKEIARYYRRALKSAKADIVALYEEIVEDMTIGEPLTMDMLYRYNRFIELQKRMNKELNKLGQEEIKFAQKKYELMGKYCSLRIHDEAQSAGEARASFLLMDDDRVRELVNSVWCNDGKHWSARVWDNQRRLQTAIEKGLMDCVARGAAKDELVKDLQSRFGAAFSASDRIARTELAYIQNTATRESYKKAGIQYVKTIVAHDERTCDICGKHEGQITPISEAAPGTAYLFHPNCRCDIIPIL